MPATAAITVRVVTDTPDGPERARRTVSVRRGTPAGAGWALIAAAASLPPTPPAEMAYVLNGERTIPAARLEDGDDLVIVIRSAAFATP